MKTASAEKRYPEDRAAKADRLAVSGPRPHMRTFTMAFAFADAVQKAWDAVDIGAGKPLPALYFTVTEKLRSMSGHA